MKPTDDRVDVAYMEALRCVQYRVPPRGEMRSHSYMVALGLRYGLVGVSATHHLLLTSDSAEQPTIFEFVHSWPLMVEDHLQLDLAPKLPIPLDADVSFQVGALAHQPLRHYLSLWTQGVPLERCLATITERFIQEHESSLRKPWRWWGTKIGQSEFRTEAQASMLYALHFFERREAGLDEVPEIALLGE